MHVPRAAAVDTSMKDAGHLAALEDAFRRSPQYAALVQDMQRLRADALADAPAAVRVSDGRTYQRVNINDIDSDGGHDTSAVDTPPNGAITALPSVVATTDSSAGVADPSADALLLSGYRSRYATSLWTQLQVLSGRSFADVYRDPLLLRTHLLVGVLAGGACTVDRVKRAAAAHADGRRPPRRRTRGHRGVRRTAVLLGLLFFNLDLNFAGIQNRFGLILFLLLVLSFGSMSAIGVRPLAAVPRHTTVVALSRDEEHTVHGYFHGASQFMARDFDVFLQERAAGYYRPSAFFLTKVRAPFVSCDRAIDRPHGPPCLTGRPASACVRSRHGRSSCSTPCRCGSSPRWSWAR